MRVLFLGTPEAAVPSLRALVEAPDIDVVGVVTNPDRPVGRSRHPQPPPVKVAAEHLGITSILQPDRPAHALMELRALALDVAAVVAYGSLLPRDVLGATSHGFVNLHFSLLPRWRGAAPVQHALRAGDTLTGVTTFVLDEGMDTGPLLRQAEVAIAPDETAGELLDRLAVVGAPILVESLRALVAGDAPTPQPEQGATLAPKIRPEDVRVDWSQPAHAIDRLVRSAAPRPGAHTVYRGDRLKLLRVTPTADDGGGEPGSVVATSKTGVLVACGAGHVRLDEVQPAGKPRIDGVAFANGYHPEPGELLGP